MPKGTINIEEIIEKMQQFSEVNSEKNEKTLKEILDLLKEQGNKIDKLNKKVTELEADLKAGKFSVLGGGGSSAQPTPTPSQDSQTAGGGGSTPSGPTEAQQKEIAWNNFFTDKSDITDKEAWKNSGLSIENAQKIYNNGWKKPKLTEYELDGQKITNIEPLNHKKDEIEKAIKLLNKIKNETNLSNLSSNEDINQAYDQSKVPSSINYDKVKSERDNKLKSLFKTAFEKSGPSKLSDEDIDKWRTTDTGLGKNGVEERKAFDNGWTKPKEDNIKDKQVPIYSYNGKETKNVDVLKVNKIELNKVHDILAEISAKKTFFELPVDYKGEKYKIANLKYDQLPNDSQEVIKKTIKNQRDTFTYKLNVENNEKKNDGLTQENLEKALGEINSNKKEPRKNKLLTAKLLNDFLNASDLKISEVDEKGDPKLDGKNKPITTPIKIEGNAVEDLDEPNEELYGKDENGKPLSWLEFQGAFKLPKELTDKEDHLDLKIKGSESLAYFYKKNNYDPENPAFCQFTGKGDKKEIPIHPKKLDNGKPNPKGGAPIDESGYLAIATGVGKTTKTTNCLVRGGERNVILVCPNAGLCSSAAQHHNGWLQTWGCVYHKKPLMKDGKPVMEDVEDPITKEIKSAPRYESHGTYPVKLNELVYYEKQDGSTEGSKGLSVLEPQILFIYLVRKLWSQEPKNKTEKSGMQMVLERIKMMKPDGTAKVKKNVVQKGPKGEKKVVEVEVEEFVPGKESYTRWVEEAVSKFVPKGAIIIYDEAHFTKAEWQIFSRFVIFLTKDMGIEVMKMSATLKGIPFSSTSTFPRKNLYMSSIQSKFKLGDEEIDFDDLLAKSKVWIFIPNAEKELNDKQKEIMKGVSNVVFSQPFDDFCESISFGMPPSTSMLVDGSKEMGFTPDTDIVILTDIMENSNLQVDWKYSTPNFSWISLASFAQQIGRVARIKNGWAITTSKELEEFVIKPEVSVYAIQMALGSTDGTVLKKMKVAGFSDVEHLRGSIALANKENKKWGLSVAELIVGASTGTAGYPKWESAKPTFRVDIEVWDKHMGTYESPKMDPQVVKDIMDVMIATYIKRPVPASEKTSANRFPFELNVEMKSSLIKEYGLDPKDVKKVLNGVIEERKKEIEEERKKRGNPNPDPVVFKANEDDLFRETVSLLRLTLETEPGKNVTVSEEADKDGKKFWVMKIKYSEAVSTRRKIETRTLDMKDSVKLQVIRALLIKHNLQAYEGDVGKEVREALEENTIQGYKNIMIKLRSARLGNAVKDQIGWSNAMSLVHELETATEKTSEELQANIEVNIVK